MQLPPLPSRDYRLRLIDDAAVRRIAEINPSWALPQDPAQFTEPYLRKVGINYSTSVVAEGFLKHQHEDFIVEEIGIGGAVSTISPHDREGERPHGIVPKLGATLVKRGFGTSEAVERIYEALGAPEGSIAFAGMKDSRALTSQELSFNGIDADAVAALDLPNMFFKDIRPRAGLLSQGQLEFNRFTIHIRTPEGTDFSGIESATQELAAKGFPNFFSLQRFNARLIGADVGRLILEKKYGDALRLFLTGKSTHEMLLLQDMRREADLHWGKWEAMYQVFNHLPYYFYSELRALRAMLEQPRYPDHGLRAIPDQVKLMVNAYQSRCFNMLVSSHLQAGDLPERIVMPNGEAEVMKAYERVLTVEELAGLQFGHPSLPFLGLRRSTALRTRVFPVLHGVKPTPMGAAFHFDLDRGAYATTFLSQIFSLYQGRPVPEWVSQESYPVRPLFGYPPESETVARFPILEVSEGDAE